MRMTVTVEFTDDGNRSWSRRVFAVMRDPADTASGDVGLTLLEATSMLNYVHHEFVGAQAAALVERARTCERCDHRRATKNIERRRVHTLFGRISLSAVRLFTCDCDGSRRRAFSPLHGWLSQCSNELRYQAARWGGEHSYREAAAILHELLPVDWRFGHVRVREAVLSAGARLEKEETLPEIPEYRPFGTEEPAATLAFDGRYVRRTRKGPRRNFEILTGVIQKRSKIKAFATVYADRARLPARLIRCERRCSGSFADQRHDGWRRLPAPLETHVAHEDSLCARLLSRRYEDSTHRSVRHADPADAFDAWWICLRAL
jgi:hypothetical protein